MNTSRVAILAGLAVALAIVAATQTCRDRSPAATSDEPVATATPKDGVRPRATDTPIDLRERDRLREDDPTDPVTPPTGVPATPEATAEAPPPERKDPGPPAEPPIVVGPPASPTIEAAALAAKAAAQDEVAKVRSEMRRKCWDGIDRGGKGDGGVKVSFSLSFDAEGHVLASAVNQLSRENYVQGLETCLGPFAHAIEVPAPGESLSVDVEVELP